MKYGCILALLMLTSFGGAGCHKSPIESSAHETPTHAPAPPPPPWLVSPTGDRRTTPVSIASGEHQEAPDIAIDGRGQLWMAWVSFPDGIERIQLVRVSDRSVAQSVTGGLPLSQSLEQWKAAESTGALQWLVLGAGEGPTGWPRLLASGDRLWVTWAETLEGRFQIRIASVNEGKLDGVGTLSESPNPAVRPAIGLDEEGVPVVVWEEILPDQIVLVARRLGGDTQPAIVDDSGELNQRPSLARSRDGTLAIAWDHYENASYDLRMRLWDHGNLQPIQVLMQDGLLDQAPSLRFDGLGQLWVAWHTNRRLDADLPRSGRTLALAQVTPQGLLFPAAGLAPSLASLPDHPDQLDSIEFPQLQFDASGRAHLFARRGQGYVTLHLEGAQWSPWLDLSEPGWGGRGRELRAVLDPEGTFHLAGRWLHRLGYSLLQPPSAGRAQIVMESIARKFENLASLPGNPFASDQLGPLYRAGLTEGVRWAESGPVGQAAPADGRTQRRMRGTGARKAKAGLQEQAWVPAQTGKSEWTGTPEWTGKPARVGRQVRASKRKRGAPTPPVLETALLDWREGGRGVRLFLGDLHTHTWVSDGAGDPDEVFTRSRDLLKFDFVALTDHDLSNGNRYAPHEWAYAQLLSNLFNKTGRFVTLVAYEWTSQSVARGGFGHRNIYFPGDSGSLFGVDAEAPDTLHLFELIRGAGAFSIPHHTSWTGTDWEHFDPSLQPLIEIVSVHGNSERADGAPIVPRVAEGGTYALDGLRKGLQFGFVGGSDGHGVAWHYGVSRQEDVWTTGLTGVFAPRLERAELHHALQSRFTYATSGPPMGLWLDANGQPMGSTIRVEGVVGFRVRVQGMGPLTSIELLRDGIPIPGFQLKDIEGFAQGVWMESPAMLQSAGGEHFYYLRIIRRDGGMAWSSPIRTQWGQSQ